MRVSKVIALAGVAAAAVSLAAISIAFERDIADARYRIHTGAQVAQTACGPMEYASAGKG